MRLFVLFKIVSSMNVQTIQSTETKLEQMFRGHSIPDGMAEWLALLADSIDVLSCPPTIPDGRCYKSETCRLPKLKFDKRMLPFVLKICRDPWLIGIYFLPLDLPWWAKVDLKPIIVDFNKINNGISTIKSDTTIKAKVLAFTTHKGSLKVNGVLRYDCTKPARNRKKPVYNNLKAPSRKDVKLFYRLKIRIEVKKWKFKWFKSGFKCIRCEDLINISGNYGSVSCAVDAADMNDYECEDESHSNLMNPTRC